MSIRNAVENIYDLAARMDPYNAADCEDTKELTISRTVKNLEAGDIDEIGNLARFMLESMDGNDEFEAETYKALSDLFHAVA